MPCRLSLLARVVVVLSFSGLAVSAYPQAMKTSTEYPDSRIDLYGGFGYLHPINSEVKDIPYQNISNLNATISATYWLSHHLGVQAEGTYFSGNGEHEAVLKNCNASFCDQLFYSAQAGPVLRYPLGPFIPFIHVLGGGARLNGPGAQPLTWGWGGTGGGGFDYVLPWFSKRIAVRPIQADFQYSTVDFGSKVGTTHPSGVGDLYALKLSAGVVVRFGAASSRQAVMLGCSAEPSSVHPGDPITVTGSSLYLDSHKKPVFTWRANGGKVTSQGNVATIDTTGLPAGEYTVQGHVSEGPKAYEQASCSSAFNVVPFEPPSITCSANPSSAPSGTVIDITTVGSSPANRPLTYSYTADAGTITSNGPTAKLATAGLGPSLITVTCSLVDDLGQTAKAIAGVTIVAPTVPVIPQTQSLCSVSFARDRARPVRVDNEAKACLDDIALTMGQQTSARLIIVGDASPDEKPEAAAERTLNVRQYLTQEKGIDSSRIEVRVGDTSGRSVNNILIPTGSTYNDANTQLFDESSIVRHGQAYGTGTSRAPVHHTTPRRHTKPKSTAPSSTPPASTLPPTPPQ
jgi:hypothetical protein